MKKKIFAKKCRDCRKAKTGQCFFHKYNIRPQPCCKNCYEENPEWQKDPFHCSSNYICSRHVKLAGMKHKLPEKFEIPKKYQGSVDYRAREAINKLIDIILG